MQNVNTGSCYDTKMWCDYTRMLTTQDVCRGQTCSDSGTTKGNEGN